MKKRNKKRKNKFRFILIISIAFIIFLMFFSPLFTIRTIQIEDCLKLNSRTIVEQSGVKLGDHLFRVNKKGIEDKLVKKGLVTNCTIKRKLPNSLIIKIKENVPIAYINTDQSKFVVHGQGTIKHSSVENNNDTLMKLEGIEIAKITENMNLFQDPQINTVFINLKKSDYFNKIKVLDVSNPQNVVVTLKNDTVIKLGKIQQINQSVKVSEKLLNTIRTNKINAKEVNIENINRPIIKKIL